MKSQQFKILSSHAIYKSCFFAIAGLKIPECVIYDNCILCYMSNELSLSLSRYVYIYMCILIDIHDVEVYHNI